jgi:GntR family transcriptional repressor for pyruvate dehydrogenase complex
MQIQHHIQEDGLVPGSFLGREDDLATQFGVSRPTLREALKLLAGGDLIRASKGPGGGIFVAHTAEQGLSRSLSGAIAMMLETGSVTLEELLDARELLEVPLAGMAAYRADGTAIGLLREVVEEETALESTDRNGLVAADAKIHALIASLADNSVVQALTGWVLEVLQPSLAQTIAEAVVQPAVIDQHRALLAAIEKGDATRAERAMRDHLRYLRDVLKIVREHDSHRGIAAPGQGAPEPGFGRPIGG